jgi:transposase
MEATGVYWKPIWRILEGRFELVLANPAHIRNIPGRKSDVNDAVWISDLLAHGLIRASFVPPGKIQDVRDLTRTRTQLAREIAQHIQRIQKTLENANIELAGTSKRPCEYDRGYWDGSKARRRPNLSVVEVEAVAYIISVTCQ